jgi:hypothetical protein
LIFAAGKFAVPSKTAIKWPWALCSFIWKKGDFRGYFKLPFARVLSRIFEDDLKKAAL